MIAANLLPRSIPQICSFAAYCDATHGAFCRVVVEFKEAMIQIAAQPLHTGECIVNSVLPDNLGRSLYGQLSRSSRMGLVSACLSSTRRSGGDLRASYSTV